MTPEKLIERILNGRYLGEHVQSLYGAFYKGYPVENLIPLITSDDDDVRATGSYIAYELGSQCRPLIPELIELLDDPSPQIRSDMVISLTECVRNRKEFEVRARLLLVLEDQDPFVRGAALKYIRTDKFHNGLREAARQKPGTIYGDISSTVFSRSKLKISKITELVNHPNPVANRYGVGWAMQPESVVNADYLEIATLCNEPECIESIGSIRERPRNRSNIGRIDYSEFGANAEDWMINGRIKSG